MKSHHYVLSAIIFLIVASVTAMVVYFSSIKVFIKDKISSLDANIQIDNQQEIKVDFVKVDPEAPIALPSGTVGGVTACERIDKIINCLAAKNKKLESLVEDVIATKGATIEETCGNRMSGIMKYRLESIKSGCIF